MARTKAASIHDHAHVHALQAGKIFSTKLFSDARKERIEDVYRFGKKLGSGNFGVVYECQEKRTGKVACMKAIAKSRLVSVEDVNDVKREVAIMYHVVGHPNVVEIYDTFEDKNNVYIVMELCQGGDFYETILEKMQENGGTPYSEKDAAGIVKVILKVVEHLNSLGVVHRDLKPENFLMTTKGPGGVLKATDFGLSAFYAPGRGFERHCGSPMYMAPEVVRWRPTPKQVAHLQKKPPPYGPECDIWSTGVIAYALLTGYPPFYAASHSPKDIYAATLRGNPNFTSHPWPFISWQAKELVQKMLDPDPQKRPTVIEALNHPWIHEPGVAPDVPLDAAVAARLKQFTSMAKFKKVALQVVAETLQDEEIEGLHQLFLDIDVDKGGTITLQELRDGLRKWGAHLTDTEVERIMEQTDVDHSGVIEYGEFLAATLHLSKVEKQENLLKAFAHFDTDGSGYITLDELEGACREYNIGKEEAADMLKEVDTNSDGKIDYGEFVAIMRKASGGIGRQVLVSGCLDHGGLHMDLDNTH
eukprot:TRINITY_DN424_c0_g4_i1.p1 TRINITY_DN424_c0_g4~~TRINITY_DN424_c0_g4_i1.p1  ORF type:complete len:531 (+),score=151.49 TRINITY_DN424_c0_g4_i1:1315-2907(+)